MGNEILAGFIREDVSTRKVYWREGGNTIACTSIADEILLYDFTKEVGDTIIVNCLADDYPLVIQQVAIEEHYGMERTVYYFEDELRQIEGIGFETGLLFPPIIQPNYGPDRIIDYCVGNDMDCGVITPDMMINPYREWHLLNSSFDFSNGNAWTATTEHRFRDTLYHDDHLYLRMQTRQQDENGPLEWEFTEYAYRQDGPRVYRYPQYAWQPDDELLVYDYSLAVGDTFSIPGMLNFLQPMIVQDIDMVVLENLEVRRRFVFTPEEWQGLQDWYWIEGIGANDHPFFPDESFVDAVDGPEVKTQCFYVEPDLDDPIWRQFVSDDCLTYIVATEDVPAQLGVEVYPNPTENLLYMESVPIGAYAKLYDMTGRLVLQTPAAESDALIELDLSALHVGIYSWELLNTDHQRLAAGRVIKQ